MGEHAGSAAAVEHIFGVFDTKGNRSVEWLEFAVAFVTCFHSSAAVQRLKAALEVSVCDPAAIAWAELREFVAFVAPHLRFGELDKQARACAACPGMCSCWL